MDENTRRVREKFKKIKKRPLLGQSLGLASALAALYASHGHYWPAAGSLAGGLVAGLAPDEQAIGGLSGLELSAISTLFSMPMWMKSIAPIVGASAGRWVAHMQAEAKRSKYRKISGRRKAAWYAAIAREMVGG